MTDPAPTGVDELFALPPGEFVAARDALVRRLRQDGDRVAAAEVKQLRRPTVAAWALNQLVRRHPDEVRALAEQGRRLAAAQQDALDGDASGLRETSRATRQTLRRLTDAADEILAEQSGATHRQEVAATLTAASVDPDAAEKLLAGRLSQPLPAPAGFGLLAGGDQLGDPAPPPAAPVADRAEVPVAEEAERAQRAAERAEAEAAAEEAQATADEAAKAAETARRLTEETRSRVHDLEAELEAARAEADQARRKADEAEAHADETREAADAASARAATVRAVS